MPIIRPSAYLRNNYNEISELCHAKMEPVFITKKENPALLKENM
jgi:hypothetical protein